MTSNLNPMQLIGMMRKSGNPQSFMINMLESQGEGNPMIANLVTLAKNNDEKAIEQIARNVMKERGLDFDKEFEDFKKQLGL